ncbi:MAG: ATP-binding protein, partial [Candidatus Binatia bacterium]
LTLDEIHRSGGVVGRIRLEPLSLSDTQHFIADALMRPSEQVRPLAELVRTKTAGNPFFVNEFLKSLHTAGLLAFDTQAHEWRWDLARIRAQNITDNVVELMMTGVQKLDVETQTVLKLAACVGNQFTLHTLAAVYEKSPPETAATLWPALAEGLVAPLDEAYAVAGLDIQGLSDEVTVEYKFVHDRIQQAAYSLIPETDKHQMHWRVGQLLLHLPGEDEAKIFDIVNHLNLGRQSLRTLSEQQELATLNLTAGTKAKAAAAYEPAFRYLCLGVELLPEDAWERQYDLALRLHIEAAEAAYLSGDFQQMEQLNAIVLRHAKTLLDKVKAYEVVLHAHTAQNDVGHGTKVGLQVLELLGERFPDEPGQADIFRILEETRQTLAGKPIEDLLHVPSMTDPSAIAKMRILSSMITLSYASMPQLFPLLVCRMITLSATYGNISFSAQAYAMYGIILCGAVGDIDTGYQFGRLAMNLIEHLNARELKASVTYMVQTFVRHWKEHIRETLPPLVEGYQIGLETGDLIFATMDAQGYGFQAYW